MSKADVLYTNIKQTPRNTAMPRIGMDVMSASILRLRSGIVIGQKSFVSQPAVCSNPKPQQKVLSGTNNPSQLH